MTDKPFFASPRGLSLEFDNLEAWAEEQGYDPAYNYNAKFNPEPILRKGYLSPNFRATEFYCNHCAKPHPTNPTPPYTVLAWLENIRANYGGAPISVNSGYRCPIHNSNVGGAKNSYHLKGMAVDFSVKGIEPSVVSAYASDLIGNEGGVGSYSSFTHIDNRGHASRWTK